jgi:hypothetical protein
MSRRSSATNNVGVGISRAIGTDIEKVQIVAANIQAVITASETDLAGLAASLEQAVDFTGITVETSAVGSAATWDASTKVLTVPTVEGAKGDSGDALEVVSITPVAGGTFEWLFSDGTLYTTPSLRGHTGDKGDTGDAGVSVGVSTIVYQGTGSFLWTFTDGTSYLTPDIRGSQGEQGIEGLKGDVGSPLELDSVIPQGGGVMLWKFNDGTDYTTPSLLGPEGEQGDTGSKGDQGVSIHHLKGTATTDPEGDFGSFGEADTFTFYGDSNETIVLGYFSIRNGFDAEADRLAATASADLAERWASEPTDSEVQDGYYSALHYAEKSLDSASISTTQATNSATSADESTGAWDSFNNIYLGPKSVPPTQNNQGGDLEESMLYWLISTESEPGKLYAYDGSDWQEVDQVVDGTTSEKGIVRLNDSVTSSSSTLAATANSVKSAYDKAAAAENAENLVSGTVPEARLREATTSVKGITRLSASVASTSAILAATSSAVKVAYDKGVEGVENAASAQSTADSAASSLTTHRGTGVTTTYVSTVVEGGTTFSQPEVTGTINSDEGYFNVTYAGATGIPLDSLASSSVYVYVDNVGDLHQQMATPTRQDWSRKMFTMRISVDTVANEILGFEYLNNPLGNYANSIRDLYSYLIANGVPFKKDQTVTGRNSDLGFDVSAGSLMEFGGTGDANNANIKNFNLVSNATYTLLSRTGVVSEETDLVKYWDNNGAITLLGSTTLVGHRLYRFSNGAFAMQYGQGNYANLALAKAGVLTEEYELNARLANATFFGWWFIESTATDTGGTTLTLFKEYTIGSQGGSSSNLAGCLLKGNNLSDLQSLEDALENLGLTSAFTDDYHPNADALTTARTVSLSGGATGSVSFDGSSDVALPVVLNNDLDVKEALLKEATLNLDFANNNYEVYEGPVDGLTGMPFNDALDFTRGSAATARNATGGINDVLVDDQRLVGNREGLLIEEQRTNLIRYSEDFSDAAWSKTNATVDTNIQIAPDGNLTADGITLLVGDSGGVYVTRTVSVNTNYTGSVYAKDSTALHSEIVFAFYDQTNSDFIAVQAYPEIEELSNGWFRLSATITTPSNCVSLRFYPVRGDFSDNEQVLVWGSQLEEGNSVTSYIPTAGTQVTRAADDCTRTLGAEFSTNGITLYCKATTLDSSIAASERIVTLSDGTYTNRVVLYRKSSANSASLYISDGNTGVIDPNLWYNKEEKTLAVSLGPDGYIFAVDGVVISSGSTGSSLFSLTQLTVGRDEVLVKDLWGSTIANVGIVPRALSATELQILTAQED